PFEEGQDPTLHGSWSAAHGFRGFLKCFPSAGCRPIEWVLVRDCHKRPLRTSESLMGNMRWSSTHDHRFLHVTAMACATLTEKQRLRAPAPSWKIEVPEANK